MCDRSAASNDGMPTARRPRGHGHRSPPPFREPSERNATDRRPCAEHAPPGLNRVIAAHELSHVELRERLGSAADKVPQWFDEGLAVVVSDDRRYLTPASGGATDRCRVRSDEALPETLHDWLAWPSDDGHRLYAVSACRVDRWLAAHGGRRALLALVDRLRQGEEFPRIRP